MFSITIRILVHVSIVVGVPVIFSPLSESAPLSTYSSTETTLSDAICSVEIFGIDPVALEYKQLH